MTLIIKGVFNGGRGMIDKVQKIKEWISKEQDGLMDAQGNFEYSEHEGAYHILCNLNAYIDSLKEEPVSEELEEAAKKHAKCQREDDLESGYDLTKLESFIAGGKWKEQQLMKNAVECEYFDGSLFRNDLREKYRDGDKVKVIIVK